MSRSPLLKRHAVGVSPAHRTVVVDGVSLAYEDRGHGPAIVCLHAIAHGSGDFAQVVDALAETGRVVTFDWPGHGRSGADAAPPTAPRFAELLRGFLDALAIDRAVLIGNSIGGSAALRFAAQHPDRVAGLVLADPGGLIPMNGVGRAVCGAMAALGRAGQRRAWYFGPLFAVLYRRLLRTPQARDQRRRIVDAAPEMARIWEQAWLGFRMPQADLTDIGGHVRCPVLFTWARRDPLVSYRLSRAAIARFPDHRVALLAGGHCPFLEAPEAFLAATGEFLARLPSPAAVPAPHRALA